MKRQWIGIMLCGLAAAMSGCQPAPILPPRTALETREIQTRSFAVKDQKSVMKAVLDALQDEGYITRNAVVDLGLITATKETDTETRGSALFSQLLMGENAAWEKQAILEATVNVSTFGPETRVRISLHNKVLDNRGAVMSVHEVEDPLPYQQLFSKIDKSVFIQSSGI